MSIVRVTEHTARRVLKTRCLRTDCNLPIRPGDRYRRLIAVRCEAFDRSFVSLTIHAGCIGVDRDSQAWWMLR